MNLDREHSQYHRSRLDQSRDLPQLKMRHRVQIAVLEYVVPIDDEIHHQLGPLPVQIRAVSILNEPCDDSPRDAEAFLEAEPPEPRAQPPLLAI
jgi:hypothetical protein